MCCLERGSRGVREGFVGFFEGVVGMREGEKRVVWVGSLFRIWEMRRGEGLYFCLCCVRCRMVVLLSFLRVSGVMKGN